MAFLQQNHNTSVPMSSDAPPPQDSASTSPPPDSKPEANTSLWEYMTNRRSRKQASMFFLGATLFTFSTLLTKRSLQYRRQITYPLFYIPSNKPSAPVNGASEAIKALQLATFQVGSGAVMVAGGLFWAFDISSIDDLRYRLRASVGQGGPRVKTDIDYQLEFDRWLVEKKKELAEREKALGVNKKDAGSTKGTSG